MGLITDGTPHCGIRRDNMDTKHGSAPRPAIEIDMEIIPVIQQPYGSNSYFYYFFGII
jgi:hypothetical protein